VLLQHVLPLLLSPALLAARAQVGDHAVPPLPQHLAEGLEQPPERKLRREDDGEEQQRQDQDDRAGAVEVLGEARREELAEVSAGAEFGPGRHEAAKGEREERGDAAEEQRGPHDLRVRGVDRPAPEVMPPDHDEDDRDQVGGVADELVRPLGHEGADAAGEVGRRAVGAGVEEPHRVRRAVAGERDEPQERQREERHAHELAHAPRKGSTHVKSP
jgi:hypothetical protein